MNINFQPDYRNILSVLENKRPNLTVGVQFAVNEVNQHEIILATELYKNIGVDYLAFKPVYKNELNTNHSENQVCADQLRADLLKAKTYEYVHYGRENYAMGWTSLFRNDTHISTHDGSAGTFYSHTSILKEKDLAIIIFVNASNIYATKAVYTLKKRLLKIYDSE